MGAESARLREEQVINLPQYRHLLLPVDASDHANRATVEAAAMATLSGAKVTACHAYAAMMHDRRFRQMEGGLPEQFRVEQELERQRDIHDDLITRGLSIITDSYLDYAQRICNKADITFARRALEGKNYRVLTEETNSGKYDLLVIGARGLGAIPGGGLGTVCARVVRRTQIDALIIKDPQANLSKGPIVVGVDGSPQAWGGLLTAITLARHWNCALHVVAAFDPYYHYVAFNRIADVLSEEAGKVFRFQEQEKLHEEIIDSGLAKIYQGHLAIAQSIARQCDIEVKTELLDGKPHDVISKYIEKVNSALLVLGKTGIHADSGLDLGGNTEHLMNDARCALLISQREYTPPAESVADITTSWTVEATACIERVPQFAQAMARTAVLREAEKQGHTVITESMVEQITATLCPAHATRALKEIVEADQRGELKASDPVGPMPWSDGAVELLERISEEAEKENIRARAQKKARSKKSAVVLAEHVAGFVDQKRTVDQEDDSVQLDTGAWQAAALARLAQIPAGFMQEACRRQAERYALEHNIDEITPEVVEAAKKLGRQEMLGAGVSTGGKCPFGHDQVSGPDPSGLDGGVTLDWSESALARLAKVPLGFMRDLTRKRIEAFAVRQGLNEVSNELIERKYLEWETGSAKQPNTMPQTDEVRRTIAKIPEFVRGMVVTEMERCARDLNLTEVTSEVLRHARGSWAEKGSFHSDLSPSQYATASPSRNSD